MRKKTFLIVAAIVVAAVLGGGFVVFRFFFVKMVRVPTGAMMNTIIPGDHLFVTKSLGQIKRGQVVVFQYPRDTETSYVARVVGLPGETILVRGNTVLINDRPLDEQRVFVTPEDVERELLEEISTEGTGPYRVYYWKGTGEPEELISGAEFGTVAPFRIPDDNFFLLGDNRDNSVDSRVWGPVPRNLIWGTAQVIYLSASENSGEVRDDRLFKRIE